MTLYYRSYVALLRAAPFSLSYSFLVASVHLRPARWKACNLAIASKFNGGGEIQLKEIQ